MKLSMDSEHPSLATVPGIDRRNRWRAHLGMLKETKGFRLRLNQQFLLLMSSYRCRIYSSI
jgi:hypothetical protein